MSHSVFYVVHRRLEFRCWGITPKGTPKGKYNNPRKCKKFLTDYYQYCGHSRYTSVMLTRFSLSNTAKKIFFHCPSASIKSHDMKTNPRSVAFLEKRTVPVLAILEGVRFQFRQRKYLFVIRPTLPRVSTEPYIQCSSYVLRSRDQKPEQHDNAANTQASKYGFSDISEV